MDGSAAWMPMTTTTTTTPPPWPKRTDPRGWDVCLAAGQAAERRFAECLRRRGHDVVWLTDPAHPVDMCGPDLRACIDGQWHLIEVKRDDIAATTKRVALEMRRNGRPSGIAATTADRLAIVVGDLAYLLPISVARRLAESQDRWHCMGDGRAHCRTEGALVPLSTLQEHPACTTYEMPPYDASGPLSLN